MREIVMPKSSMTMTEGELSRWVRSEGDEVAEGDVVAEILTDKVEMEVEAPSSGRLGILVPEGSTVAVGTPIAVVLADHEAMPEQRAAPGGGAVAAPAAGGAAHEQQAAADGGQAAAAVPSSPPGEASVGREDGRLRATPAARAMAKRVGIDLSSVPGSGPRGRIKSNDVAAAQQTAAPAREPALAAGDLEVGSRGRPRGIRGAMARHMSIAASIPQFTLFADVIMAAADAARRDHEGVSLTDLIVRASALALREHPALNAHFVDGEIVQFSSVNVGLAVDTPAGLVVPVIKGADQDLRAVAAKRAEITDAARLGRLRPDEMEGATFTISNLGMYGIDVFQPVVDPPRVAILSMGRMRGDAGRTATLGLAADHRAVDGAQGARFLATVKAFLERPDRYLV